MPRIVLHPAQDIEAADARHLEIEKKKRGDRILAAVGVFAVSLQISDDFFAIGDDARRVLKRNVTEGALEKKGVTFIIFSDKNVQIGIHQSGIVFV